MTPLLATLLLTPAAPVPKPSPPPQNAYAYLGIRMSPSDARLAIESPEIGAPSHRAGLRGGDEIVQLGVMRPTTFDQISEYILDQRPGTDLYVEVRRNGKIVSSRLVLGVRPGPPEYPDPRDLFLKRAGIAVPYDDR